MIMRVARLAVPLAGVAVLGVAIALYLGHRSTPRSALPAPAGPWHDVLAGPYVPKQRTACGVRASAHTMGVAHPVLPCGVKLYIRYGDKTVLTQVLDRGNGFLLTPALARVIDLQGRQTIQYTFTR
jgi:hypothetical protein